MPDVTISLVTGWWQEEDEEVEVEGAGQSAEALQRDRERRAGAWRAQQLREGTSAEDNANFQVPPAAQVARGGGSVHLSALCCCLLSHTDAWPARDQPPQYTHDEQHGRMAGSGSGCECSSIIIQLMSARVLQPLAGDWRAKVRAAKAPASGSPEPEPAPENAAAHQLPTVVPTPAGKPDLAALSVGLPEGWKAMWDRSSKQTYYGNLSTKVRATLAGRAISQS